MYKYPEYPTSENPNPEQTFPNIKRFGTGNLDCKLPNNNEGYTGPENEGVKVFLDWFEYKNTNFKNSVEGDKPNRPVIILMPGNHTEPEAVSIDQMSGSFLASAEQLGVKNLYSIQTRVEGSPKDKILLEIEAMKQFLLKFNLNEVILAGFSQGALKMGMLASELSEETINVKGLALINPVGLYKQNPFRMIMGFIKGLVLSPLVSKNIQDTVTSELDVLTGIVKEWRKSGFNFPKTLIKEIAEMSDEHPEFSSIKCPVIVIQGDLDPIVDPREIAKLEQIPMDNQNIINEILGAIFTNSPKTRWLLEKGSHFAFFNNPDDWTEKVVDFISTSSDLPGKSQE